MRVTKTLIAALALAASASLAGPSKAADSFNVANAIYKKPENVDAYIDASFTDAK